MNKKLPETTYVFDEGCADSESRINRAFDIIFEYLREQYQIKKLNKTNND